MAALRRIANLFRRSQVDWEIDAELRCFASAIPRLLGSASPLRRAPNVDPAQLLREE